MEQLILAVKAAVEDYLTAVGLDVNLDEMSQADLQAFFTNPPEGVNKEQLQKVIESTVILNQGTDEQSRQVGGALALGLVEASAMSSLVKVFDDIPWGQVGEGIGKAWDEATGWVGKLFGGSSDDVAEGSAGIMREGDAWPQQLPGQEAGVQGRTDVGGESVTPTPPLSPKQITGFVGGTGAAGQEIINNVEGVEGERQRGDVIPDFLQGEIDIFGMKIPSPFGVEDENVFVPEGGGSGFEGTWPGEDDDPSTFLQGGTLSDLETPIGGVPKVILKELYFDGISEQSAFDKLTNWLGGKSILSLDTDGRSLVQALEAKEKLGNINIYNLALAGEPGDVGRNIVRNFLTENWERIPEIRTAMEGSPLGLDQAINGYIEKMAKQSPYFITKANIETIGGEETISYIGLTASFDGTPFGTVQSLNDLFSGGKIGHFNLTNLLESASPEQMELWQQQLYSWGFMSGEPNSWGIADEQTLMGMNKWHTTLINEGLAFKRQNKNISEDGSPLADSVQNQAILKQMGQLGQAGTRDSIIRQSVIDDASTRVEQYLNNTGRILPEGSREMLKSGLGGVIKNMGKETTFGQGGTQRERSLAESMLSEYYGNEDWGSMLQFGNSDTDKEYLQYALKAGALSPEELKALQDGILDPSSLRGNNERQKDVAVSVLLGFLREAGAGGQGMGGLNNSSIEHISSALRKYMHTSGAAQYRTNPLSEQDLLVMAHNVQNVMNNKVYDNNAPLAQAVAKSGIQEMGLEGGTAGYQYRQLVDALNTVRPGPQGLGVRNV